VVAGSFFVAFLCIAIIATFLSIESLWARKARSKIPLRVCVTGTRGKSSVTRLITSVFQEHGIRTIGKVTGTQAMLLLPNQQEKRIFRKGTPTILEQVRVLLRSAVSENCQAVVSEIMSISPEMQRAESIRILHPHITVITNIRMDHIGITGSSIPEIGSAFLDAVPPRSIIVMRKEDWILSEYSLKKLQKRSIRLEWVDDEEETDSFRSSKDELQRIKEQLGLQARLENLLLADRVARLVGIPVQSIQQGILEAKKDPGALEITIQNNQPILIPVFSANDPESTWILLDQAMRQFSLRPDSMVGVLCLRADKPERTWQWKQTFLATPPPFKELFLIGKDAHALKRGLPKTLKVSILNGLSVKDMVRAVRVGNPKGVIGFGNHVGWGERWQAAWNSLSEEQPTCKQASEIGDHDPQKDR